MFRQINQKVNNNNNNMSKNNKNIFHIAKRSEYRNNYLPFNYYDFMITAKENENLRFQNKLRDYLHTPFDWDEDQDFYFEQEREKNFHQASQASQTADQPRHGHHQQYVDAQPKPKSTSKNKKQPPMSADNEKRQVQINNDRMEQNNPNTEFSQKRSKSKSAKKANKINNNKELFLNLQKRPSTPKVPKKDIPRVNFNSISSTAVQTPLAWNLRDYNNIEKPKRALTRSASVSNLQTRKVPFANYGWATKTKDLSLKPTHNALANKTLARHHDQDAILELTLQKLKRDAMHIANEYSAVDSEVADHFHNRRSESRVWNSEYDEKYPDHSRSASRNELYFTPNPNRMSKSSLANDQPSFLKRGPRSAKAKIYYQG